MANLLLVDSDGRRRVRLEMAAQAEGHRTYSAGTAAEALRMAQVYVPDAILLADGLPDSTASAFLQSLRNSEKALLQNLTVITPDAAAHGGDPDTVKARNAEPEAMLSALEKASSTRLRSS